MQRTTSSDSVIPAKAGIQKDWIPVRPGMTDLKALYKRCPDATWKSGPEAITSKTLRALQCQFTQLMGFLARGLFGYFLKDMSKT